MKYKINSLLAIPADVAAPLLLEQISYLEQDEAQWASFGRTLHQRLHSDQFIQETAAAQLWDSNPPAIAERLRAFLTKGTSR